MGIRASATLRNLMTSKGERDKKIGEVKEEVGEKKIDEFHSGGDKGSSSVSDPF